ncbi:MAG: DUF4127 family protein, partial [Candidatus Melainabacteria bacterium]|nr:DUF4127 family protein [Candidatus Melainabacteria bacterium]
RAPIARIEFSPQCVSGLPSRYEGQKIGDTAYSQLAACGIKLAQDKSEPVDFVVIVHGSKKLQGDHISLPGEPNLSSMDTKDSVSQTIQLLKSIDTPIILCDVAYANGSDPMLLQELFNHKELVAKLWGYSGWNTTGNTIGSALSLATAKWFAENKAGYIDNHSFKQCLFTRFADDWAYQSQVRSSLSHPVTSQVLTQLMEPYLNTIANVLYYQPNGVKLSFPWNRTFEIEMDLGR